MLEPELASEPRVGPGADAGAWRMERPGAVRRESFVCVAAASARRCWVTVSVKACGGERQTRL